MVVVADVADYKAMCRPSPGSGVIYDRVVPLVHMHSGPHGPGGPDAVSQCTLGSVRTR